MDSNGEITRHRALSLFTYLRELAQLGSAITRHWSEYDQVIWLHEIPDAPEVRRMAWRDTDAKEHPQVWIEIKKPELKDPPRFPAELKLWVDDTVWRDCELDQPALKPSIRNKKVGGASPGDKKAADQVAYLNDHPEISDLWRKYVDEKWKNWSAEERKRRSVQKVYEGFFSLFQKQQQQSERYELVLSIGLLAWKPAGGIEIHRHVLTAQTHLTFESSRGIISVNAAGEGAKLTLEQDMLDEPPNLRGESLEQKLSEIGDAIWDTPRVGEVLSIWINRLSAKGRYAPSLEPQERVFDFPTIHLAPAIVLRRRGEKGYVTVLKDILTEIENGMQVPEAVRSLISTYSDPRGDIGNSDNTPDEIYFPKSSNEEQEKIVRRLHDRHGLVVQGPPGTGKSHTIANLVSHLLAMGQRVLVTSHSPRALRVLRDKFPKTVSPLCIMLLDDDRQALKELEDSVSQITKAFDNWNPDENQKRIEELERQLGKARAEESEILRRVRERRSAETAIHEEIMGCYRGTFAEIARQLKEQESGHSWIPDVLADGDEPPLSDNEAKLLIKLLCEKTDKQDELSFETIDPNELPTPLMFRDSVKLEERLLLELEAASPHRSHSAYSALLNSPKSVLAQLVGSLTELKSRIHSLMLHEVRWMGKAVTDVLSNRGHAWREAVRTTEENLDAIEPCLAPVATQEISGLNTINRDHAKARATVKQDANDLLLHFESGGKLGFWIFRPKVVKKCQYLLNTIYVDGQQIDKPASLRKLLSWIDLMEGIDILKKVWTGLVASAPTGMPAVIASHYRSRCQNLKELFSLKDSIEALRQEVFSPYGILEPDWSNIGELDGLLAAIRAVDVEDHLTECKQQHEALENRLVQTTLSSISHPRIQQACKAIRNRDFQEYAECHNYLSELWGLHQRADHCDQLLERLKHKAPELTRILSQGPSDNAWDTRMAQFARGWNWARCNSWLNRVTDTRDEAILNRELQRLREDQASLIEKMVAEKAWRHCFDKMADHELTNLKAWKQEMKLVGKGMGKHASRHRDNAKKHMKECRSAIPAWIMPIYRVAQTVSPRAELFDVVVVDEASQAGPEALFLTYLAKKMVVVGDDKQISPETFIDQDKVGHLQKMHLEDFPNSNIFGVEFSLFDIAKIFYTGLIRLTEHFRCMPEIIQFSNNLCYTDTPLVPLRQHGMERLEPLQVVEVSDGYERGERNVINPPEAEAITNKIAECVEDSRYENRTMGVISLLGRSQAQYIEELLRKRIGPVEMAKRQLICGEAYAFQGDERDVIFLSMVRSAREGRAVAALVQAKDERRFNVAASRAKDQVWLFHTVTLNDLRKECLRYKLIDYYYHPHVEGAPEFEELLARINEARRSLSGPPDPFDSWFEVDIFKKIGDRGFRVIPQFQVGNYFIDLVIEGMKGRLAVECDGDSFHGPERYDPDMARQRALERCGWQFWRIRASSFYREPDSSLVSLWKTLQKMEIYPNAS
jgi:very-short-patch-repair endonuclease